MHRASPSARASRATTARRDRLVDDHVDDRRLRSRGARSRGLSAISTIRARRGASTSNPTVTARTVTFAARIGPGPSGLTPAIEAMPDKEERIIERRLEEFRRNMETTLDGIAAMVGGD